MTRPLPWMLGAFLAAACSSVPQLILPPEEVVSAVAPPAEYIVGPGDVLRVNVYGHPDLSSQLYTNSNPGTPVDGAGRIQLPLIDPIEVSGMSVIEVREAVTLSLKSYLKDPRVDVAVTEFRAHRYVVLGEVNRPGVYGLSKPITALEAMAKAGGFSPSANRSQFIWMKGGLREENLMLLDGRALDGNLAQLISHGDVIFVGRRAWVDRAEAVKDVIPILQAIAIPIATAANLVALERLL